MQFFNVLLQNLKGETQNNSYKKTKNTTFSEN